MLSRVKIQSARQRGLEFKGTGGGAGDVDDGDDATGDGATGGARISALLGGGGGGFLLRAALSMPPLPPPPPLGLDSTGDE